MRGIIADIFRIFPCRRLFKMSGVSRDAPFGIQSLQWISGKLLPRLQINRLLWYQVSVLILTYFTYMTYHLTRKPISVVKSVLHRNCSGIVPPPGTDPGDETWCDWAPFNTNDANTLLGTLDSAFLFTYAGAMFVSGMIAERVDLRYFLSFGMLISAIFCYLFGVGKTANIHNISYYLLVQGGAGIAQTSGWPGTVAAVGRWCGSHRRGLVFGLWNSHTSIGNILGTLIAAEYVETDWALSFIYPALAMGVVAAIVFLFLPADPAHVGLVVPGPPETSINRSRRSSTSTIEESPAQVSVGSQTANLRQKRHSTVVQYDPEEVSESTSLLHRESSHSAISFSRAFAIPGVMEFSLSLFFAKLVSYTFLYWLPLYINTSTSLPAAQAGALSTLFDVGGALGAVLAGALADAAAAPASVCCAFYALCAPALLIYQRWGAISYGVNVVLLLIAGALVNGPYALITTAVSAQLGTQSNLVGNAQALATVTAIIDGTGSIGAAVGPMLAGVVSSGGDWSRVFYMLICCDVLALLLLLRITKKEFTKIRQQRRTGSPRLVRIE